MKRLFFILILTLLTASKVLADKFVPNFAQMKNLKCTINEEIKEKNGEIVTKNLYYRFYNLDDENQKIYLQKAPVDKILAYDENKIEFLSKHLTDDFIMQSKILIDRSDYSIKIFSTIDYDSDFFSSRSAYGVGKCEINLPKN